MNFRKKRREAKELNIKWSSLNMDVS